MKKIIPLKIYFYLLAFIIPIILIHLFIWGINKQKIDDLSLNLLSEIVGILITLFVVDRLIKKYEKDKWLELDKRINIQIEAILFTIFCTIFYFNDKISLFYEVRNSNDIENIKFNKYSEMLKSFEINAKFCEKITREEILAKFFIDIYNTQLNNLNAFLNDFNGRLDHRQLPLLLDLRISTNKILEDLKLIQFINASSEIIGTKTPNDSKVIENHVIEFVLVVQKLVLLLPKSQG